MRKEHLKKRIKEEFTGSRGTYGPDRIIVVLRKKGKRLGWVKCRDLKEEMALTSCHNRHKAKSLTNSKMARG